MDWQEVSGNWIWVPRNPKAIIHFLGGAFVAAAPNLTYRWLLEHLGRAGYVIIATPFINTFDHAAIAKEVVVTFDQGLYYLHNRVLNQRYLPVYGLGHSMGCKLHLLINSLWQVERAGNIFMSFNNYPAKRSIPFLELVMDQVIQFNPSFSMEFTPSPEETLALITEQYMTQQNLLIKFRNDDIDQTRPLSEVLVRRFPDTTSVKILKGTHTTPIAQDIAWEPGSSFTPFDAIGQFMKQEFYRDLNQLKQTLLTWLDFLDRQI
ncbi:MAG TPA: DUF1350 family protein [Leptolyngbyaceae cyanobacterium]